MTDKPPPKDKPAAPPKPAKDPDTPTQAPDGREPDPNNPDTGAGRDPR